MDWDGKPLSEYELRIQKNIQNNYEFMKSIGHPVPTPPKFPKQVKIIQQKRKKKKSFSLNGESDSSESSDDSDEEWKPGVSEETIKKNKMIKRFMPEFRPKKSSAYSVTENTTQRKSSNCTCTSTGLNNIQTARTVENSLAVPDSYGDSEFEELGRLADQLENDESFFDVPIEVKEKQKHDTGSIYPKRPRAAHTSYREAEVPGDDHYMFCEDCQVHHYGECPVYGPLHIISDATLATSSSTAARASLPDCLEIKTSSIPNAGLGVFAKSAIVKGARFGPYHGRKVKLDDMEIENDGSYMWEVTKDGKVYYFVDGYDETTSNWMRFVNCSRCEREQNLVAFQYRGEIYYRSYKEIPVGTELLVWYGDKYAEDLGISVDTDTPKVQDPVRGNTQRGYKCMKCNKCFTSSNMLLRHVKHVCLIPPTKKELKCQLCLLQCSTAKDLTEHLETHCTKTSLKECPLCKKMSTKHTHMIRHLRCHTGYRPYECEHCKKTFNESANLKTHLRIHTGEKLYQCTYCDKAFNVSGHLKTHLRIHTGEKPYQCTYCDKAFNESCALKTHLRIHTGDKPYQCTYCDKAFTVSGALKRHLRIHSGDKPYQCTYSDKAFNQSGALKRHLRIHTGDKPYQCTYCDKTFNESANLKTHLRIHTGEKPYQCTYCDKAFNESGALKTHLRIHTGDKPYQCTYCDKAFTVSGALKRHLRIHSGDKPVT